MNYQPTKRDASEAEILTADERKLSALLGGLKRVEAPKDFDFKLKARIAAVSPVDERKTSIFPALRYVLPLFLVVLLSGFAALRIFAPSDAPQPVTATETFQQSNKTEIAVLNMQETPIVPDGLTEKDFNTNKAATISVKVPKERNNTKQTLAVIKSPEKRGSKQDIKLKNAFGGDYERTTRHSRVINESVSASPNSNQGGKLTIREVLSEIGIEVEFVGANCKVKSVREGTAARIANFQPGDLIETIDDKQFSSETVFSQSVSGKVFRVVRAGKQIVIDLTKR
jgi:hypothetical protein